MSARQARAVMAVLIALHGAGAVFFVPFDREPGESVWDKVLFASLSSVWAPSALLAFWAVFGPPCLAIRLPVTVLPKCEISRPSSASVPPAGDIQR